MSADQKIYIATVALERNRWGSKEPSFLVSDWVDRFAEDGFDGVELWENHYLAADAAERERLEGSGCVAIYNSYVKFDDDAAEDRARAAEAVKCLLASGVKYNFANKSDQIDEYRRNLIAWEKQLPSDCALLCECHGGTVLDTVEVSKSVFDGLDPARFGMMVHCSASAEAARGAGAWFQAFGDRIQHIHVQLRDPEFDPSMPAGRAELREALAIMIQNGFRGNVSVEFTRGIGKDEDIEVLYKNACTDLQEIRAALAEL